MIRKINVVVLILVVVLMSLIGCSQQTILKKSNNIQPLIVEEPAFPIRSIQLVIPYAPGGGTDGVGRALTLSANHYFTQPIIAVNKLGKSGARGLREGLFANNDGYTVTLVTAELNTLATFNLIDFDYRDIEPLMLLNSEPGVVVVSKDFPFNSIEELVNYIQVSGEIFSIGSAGEGSMWHIAAKGVEKETNISFDYKYYDGTSIAVVDVLGGQLDIVIAGISEVIEHVDNKQLKVLTVLADERINELPNVKTFKESGYDFSINTWRGLAVPKNIDADVKETLLQGFTNAAQDTEFIELLGQINLNYDYRNQEDFAKLMEENYNFFQELKATMMDAK